MLRTQTLLLTVILFVPSLVQSQQGSNITQLSSLSFWDETQAVVEEGDTLMWLLITPD